MRKIIAGGACSLDGYIEGPNGEYDWIIFDKEEQAEVAKMWKEIDTMLYGRKTYEAVIAMQAQSKSNPFAHMKHYVFSKTLQSVSEGFILVNGDTENEVRKLRNEEGKNIAVFGGAKLTCSLLNLGLIDEIQLAIMPVILGKGKPFFSDVNGRANLALKEDKFLSSGVVRLNYEVKEKRSNQKRTIAIRKR